MSEMDKNMWVDDVLKSTEGMKRAQPSSKLFAKIEQKLDEGITYAKRVPLRTVGLAAASIVLLVAINITTLGKRQQPDKQAQKAPVETVIEYYGLNEELINY